MNKLRKIWSLFGSLFVVLMVVLAVLLVGVRFVGFTPYAVLSGSMEPAYHVGSLIYVKDIEPAEIEVGMPITFVVNEDLLVATHRVVDIKMLTTAQEEATDEQGNTILREVELDEPVYYFQTKGDANDTVDGAAVHHKNVIGTPVFSIPYLGFLSSWLQTRQGTIMGCAIALVVLILTFMPDILDALDDEPEKKRRRKGAETPDGEQEE